jgi:hypothetical protein
MLPISPASPANSGRFCFPAVYCYHQHSERDDDDGHNDDESTSPAAGQRHERNVAGHATTKPTMRAPGLHKKFMGER